MTHRDARDIAQRSHEGADGPVLACIRSVKVLASRFPAFTVSGMRVSRRGVRAGGYRRSDAILRRRGRDVVRGLPGRGDGNRAPALAAAAFGALRGIAPAFWLRRLRARLVGLDTVDYVPLAATIHVRDDSEPGRERSRADVTIESEHVLIALVTLYGTDDIVRADGRTDPFESVIDNAVRLAGDRDCYVGIITSGPNETPRAVESAERYGEWCVSLGGSRGGWVPAANLCGVGWTTWGDVAAILQDAASAGVLDERERNDARRALRALASAGISPAR